MNRLQWDKCTILTVIQGHLKIEMMTFDRSYMTSY